MIYGIDEEVHENWNYHMMIVQNHQGKGFGLKAVELMIEVIRIMKEDHLQTPSHFLMSLLMNMQNVSTKKDTFLFNYTAS